MTAHRIFAAVLLIAAAVLPARATAAQTLTLAHVDHTVACKFSPTCTLVADDWSDTVVIPGTSGSGFLQSRLADPAPAGTPGAGLIPYRWRLDLTGVSGFKRQSCVRKLTFRMGEITPLNYDWDRVLEDGFVITSGGVGTVAPVSATLSPNLTIDFGYPGVCPGVTSYFFGFASAKRPRFVPVHLELADGTVIEIQTRAATTS